MPTSNLGGVEVCFTEVTDGKAERLAGQQSGEENAAAVHAGVQAASGADDARWPLGQFGVRESGHWQYELALSLKERSVA